MWAWPLHTFFFLHQFSIRIGWSASTTFVIWNSGYICWKISKQRMILKKCVWVRVRAHTCVCAQRAWRQASAGSFDSHFIFSWSHQPWMSVEIFLFSHMPSKCHQYVQRRLGGAAENLKNNFRKRGSGEKKNSTQNKRRGKLGSLKQVRQHSFLSFSYNYN